MARILIADREPTSLLELAVHLSERGHIVESAESLSEAKTKTQWLLPQICICEYELADGTTAPELCEQLRRMAPATEFIICTTRALEFVITLCEAVGMRGHYFKKPCDTETLTWVVEGLICAKLAPKPLTPVKELRRVRAASSVRSGGSVSDLVT